MRFSRYFRTYFYLVTLVVLLGVAIEFVLAFHLKGGYFETGWPRALNVFSYFTIQSNILVGATSLLLAVGYKNRGDWFWGLRLSALIAILITFIVQHLFLARPLEGWPLVSDTIVHTIVPIMALVGWLVFGPRGHISKRSIVISIVFPVAWLVFTFIRGAVNDWYPYYFLNAHIYGYTHAVAKVVIIAALFLSIGFAAKALDKRLLKR